jgi:catechol 2,3-dioxygenase-like lactoylglutathione lyase family enzyme
VVSGLVLLTGVLRFGATATAQSSLPLANLGIEHLDIVVPDPAASARWYAKVFRTSLHQQPVRDTLRYFVLLGDLPADRQVGYIAIGAAQGRAPSIGHYCVLAQAYARDAFAAALRAAGLQAQPTAPGPIGMWPDPDGLELQLFQPPAGLVTAAVDSPLPVEGTGVVSPQGVDHVLLQVSNLERSLAYYRALYGAAAERPRDANGRVWFQLERGTRLGLEQTAGAVRIAHYAIRVAPFDRQTVTRRFGELGVRVLPAADEPDVIRFADDNGIIVELRAAAAPQQARSGAPADLQPDTPGTGRFPAIKEEVASLPAHVVYRPKDLSAFGRTKLGVVAWGNGGCSDDGASTRFHLLEIASHGYLVIASGRILSGPGAPPREPRPAGQAGQIQPPRTKASDLTDAIDWALAENTRAGSPYFGRIDPTLVALSGWSCGGLQALQVAKDPRVKTMVLQNTGVFIEGPGAIPGMDVRKDVLATLHTPTIYILGGPKDIAYANGMDDFARITHVPVAVANLPVGHGGTYFEPNGGAAASVAVSWLDWQLRGDTQSAGRFVGENCGLCRDAQWSLQRKQFPATAGGR